MRRLNELHYTLCLSCYRFLSNKASRSAGVVPKGKRWIESPRSSLHHNQYQPVAGEKWFHENGLVKTKLPSYIWIHNAASESLLGKRNVRVANFFRYFTTNSNTPKLPPNKATNAESSKLSPNNANIADSQKFSANKSTAEIPNSPLNKTSDADPLKLSTTKKTTAEIPKSPLNKTTNPDAPKLSTTKTTTSEIPKLSTTQTAAAAIPKLSTNKSAFAEIPKVPPIKSTNTETPKAQTNKTTSADASKLPPNADNPTLPPKKDFSDKSPISWKLILGVVGVAGGVLLWMQSLKKDKEKRIEQNRQRYIGKAKLGGDWTLMDHFGNQRSSKDFHGQWLLIYFGFTHCPDVCPAEIEKIVNVIKRTDDNESLPKIQPILISVDPERDTPAALKDYCGEFSPRLLGFTGTAEEVLTATRAYRVYFSAGPKDEDSDYIVDHSIISYLVNPKGEFVDFFGQDKTVDQIYALIKLHVEKYTVDEKKSTADEKKSSADEKKSSDDEKKSSDDEKKPSS